MSIVPPISVVSPSQALTGLIPAQPPQAAGSGSFASFLSHGIQAMETKVAHADKMVRQFALDDSIPVHQVTFALEEARLSVELAMQVRSRLLEGYRDLMNMQL